jgi:hypothetical protein
LKHVNKPAEKDPNACIRSKTVIKMSGQEMREALASVMTFRDRARAALFAPYSLASKDAIEGSKDSSSTIIDLWKYSQDSKNADKPKDEVLTAQAIY